MEGLLQRREFKTLTLQRGLGVLGAATARVILAAAFAGDDWQLGSHEGDGPGAIHSFMGHISKVELNEGGLAESVSSLHDRL